MLLAVTLIAPVPASAASVLLLVPDQALRFGSFVVAGSGSRTVSATGAVNNSNVLPVGGGSTGPAQFTLTYDRGASATGPITVAVLLTLSPPSNFGQNGLVATVSGFDTDLSGIPLLNPGQSILFTMRPCSTQICAQAFHVGGRIDVTQPGKGGTIAVPLNVTATLVAAL